MLDAVGACHGRPKGRAGQSSKRTTGTAGDRRSFPRLPAWPAAARRRVEPVFRVCGALIVFFSVARRLCGQNMSP